MGVIVHAPMPAEMVHGCGQNMVMRRLNLNFLTRVDRYIARLIFVPLVATLVLAAMLLLLDKMLRLFDFVVSEGGPVGVVWQMLANMIPEYMALGIPIGLLLGVLLAFRKLALSSELDSLRAVGLGYGRLLRVPYFYAAALMALNVAIVGFVSPKARYAYEELRFELRSGALGASIKVGEFNRLSQRITLRVERSDDDGRHLHGVFVRAETADGRSVAATADLGTIEAFRGRGDGNDEFTLPELIRIGRSAEAPEKLRDSVRANFHFRMVEIAMMALMPLLAVALAVPPKRSTSGLGIFLSIVMVVTYHKVNQYAEQMAAQDRLDPVLALWTPFAVFAAIIMWMYWTLAHKPGGQPIGALERAFAKTGKAIGRILRIRRKQPGLT